MEEKVFSVSDYIRLVNQSLKDFRSRIMGEVSEVGFGPTGHVYFTLKDEKEESVIKCVIWKFKYDICGVELKEGIKIIATGYPEIYAPWGRLSFKCEFIEHAGEGALKKEYEKLKEKLTEKGYFKEDRKRPIPEYPQKVGIITSKQGAVLADFLNNLGRFGFKIKMIDSRVEGQAAIQDLLSSIKTMKKRDVDVLIIMRGGGSLESMLAFNNELLVEEIANFPVPIIAAIGHDKDVPLAALAADRLVSTPSIAAIILSEKWQKAVLLLEEEKRNIFGLYDKTLEEAHFLINKSTEIIYRARDLIFNKYKEIKNELKNCFQKIKNNLQNNKNNLNDLRKKLVFNFKLLLSAASQRLEHSEKIVYLHNPETRLKLGYSIVRQNNKLIKSVKETKIGKELDIQVVDGEINSRVKKISKNNKKYG